MNSSNKSSSLSMPFAATMSRQKVFQPTVVSSSDSPPYQQTQQHDLPSMPSMPQPQILHTRVVSSSSHSHQQQQLHTPVQTQHHNFPWTNSISSIHESNKNNPMLMPSVTMMIPQQKVLQTHVVSSEAAVSVNHLHTHVLTSSSHSHSHPPLQQTQQHDFPWAMYGILETADKRNENDIVSWGPDGIGFQIHDRDQFIERYMKTMTKMSRFKSFQRQVNFWGFQSRYQNRGTKTPGFYFHPDFIRGEQHRLEGMKRVPPARARKKEWDRCYQKLLEYIQRYQTSRVPVEYNEDCELARWVQEQRTLNLRVSKHFTNEIQLLKKLPDWTWASEDKESLDTANVLASLVRTITKATITGSTAVRPV